MSKQKTLAKTIFLLGILFYSLLAEAQVKVVHTDTFLIEEKGKTLSAFTISQADSFTPSNIGDVTLVNSRGEKTNVRTKVKGILLREVLGKISLNVTKTKELNQYIFLLEATDGYKTVLSHNEVFNTNNIYIITASKGVSLHQSPDRIEVIALSEENKGHIYIKGLRKLTIHKID